MNRDPDDAPVYGFLRKPPPLEGAADEVPEP
jgi:hypothetical protein